MSIYFKCNCLKTRNTELGLAAVRNREEKLSLASSCVELVLLVDYLCGCSPAFTARSVISRIPGAPLNAPCCLVLMTSRGCRLKAADNKQKIVDGSLYFSGSTLIELSNERVVLFVIVLGIISKSKYQSIFKDIGG